MTSAIDLNARSISQPGTLLPAEAAWNPQSVPSMSCRNTGIDHVGLHASNPGASAEFYRDVLSAWPAVATLASRSERSNF
jgi:hypothetical protein